MHSFGRTFSEDDSMNDGAVTDDLTCQLFIKSSLLGIFATLSQCQLFVPTEKNTDKRVEFHGFSYMLLCRLKGAALCLISLF